MRSQMEQLLKKNPVISNAVHLTKTKTTDNALAQLRNKRLALKLPADISKAGGFARLLMLKQLILTSPRNNHFQPLKDNPLVAFSLEELLNAGQEVQVQTNF